MNKRVMVIAAHPDDEVLGCGGVLARHAAEGDTVVVLLVTRGAAELYSDEQVNQVRAEMAAAHQVLGVERVEFLDFPAPMLDMVPGHKLADGIGRVLRGFGAEIVYIPYRGDLHGDHQAVYLATLVAARPIEGCPVRKLLVYETLSETDWAPPVGEQSFVPTVFVDIAPYLERKLNALRCYASQLKSPPHPRSLQAIQALATLRGSTAGVAAAEAFMLVREIV